MRQRPRLLFPLLLLLGALAGGCAAPVARPDSPAPALVVSAGDAEYASTATAVEEPVDLPGSPGGPAGSVADPADPAGPAGDPPADTVAAAAAAARTQAEQDFDAIYGGAYDPVADATLPSPAVMPSIYDPWEPLNRRVHAFNNAVDRRIATPLARAYVAVVPRPVRLGVSNFFSNLGQPASAVNALLQGKPAQAGASLGRFVVNATLGVAGFFDPASSFNIPNRSEDFGQTLGVWGWQTSRYVELPLFGPRTVRDVFGLVGDAPLSVVQQVSSPETRYFLQGLQLVDLRTQLFALDSMREGATDEYALFRDSWMQRRTYQIFGDRMRERDDSLPDYLEDEQTMPNVPVDVMPIVPGGG